jgi:iron(III) transport system permease protein
MSGLLGSRQRRRNTLKAAVLGLWRAPFILRAIISVALFVAILTPFYRLVTGSFRKGGALKGGDLTLEHYERIFSDSSLLQLLGNTLVFAAGQTILPVSIGVVLAWLVTRTDMPLGRFWEFGTLSLYFTPLLAAGTAWIILLGPRNGVINVVIRDYTPFGGLSAYSLGGMILIQSMYLVPLVFLIVGASFRSVNPEFEQASRICGASPWATFIRITFGVARPAVGSAAVLCFIIGLGSLEVPLLFGMPGRTYLLTTEIYSALRVQFPANYGRASALSVLLLLMAAMVLWLYIRSTRNAQRYVTVGGRSARPLKIRLGRWRWVAFGGCSVFFFFALVLPLTAVVIGSTLPYIGRPSRDLLSRASLDNYREVWGNPILGRAVRNSLTLSLFTGLIVVIVSALIAYFSTRLRSLWSRSIDLVATLPLMLPAIVVAVGLLISYINLRLPIIGSMYGSLWIMGLAYFAYFIPVAVRQMTGPMYQVSTELEHASRVCGASQMATMGRIMLPLMLPAMSGVFLLAFISFMREFVNSVLLFGPKTEVISVLMYNYYSNGRLPSVAVVSVGLSLLVIAVFVFMSKVLRARIRF